MESAAGPPGARGAEGRTQRGGALSSAILYVAIVAIWAVVLIPRWLRRDSSSSSSSEQASGDLSTAEPDATVAEEPAPRPRREDPVPAARAEARAPARAEARAPARPKARPEVPEARREVPEARREAPPGEPRDGSHEQEHKRMLSARRRLLGLLLILAVGSGALAVTKLAAWWVIVPPTAMLLGYMALLREAAQADAERREMAPIGVARTTATAPPAVAVPAVPVPAASPAPVPDAEVIDISATIGPAGEEFYDQYADAKMRAVGDLARALAS